jgi:asparagine synthase (glutamine-hydrolysing)
MLQSSIEATLDRMLSGVRRVAVLTGGLDSSALLAFASRWAKRTGGSEFVITLDFDGPGDDRPHLRALEQMLNTEIVRVAPEAASRHWSSLREGVDALPIPGPSALFEIELIARARAEGAECVLTGAGGDELFDGVPRSLARLAARGRLAAAVRSAERLSGFARPRSPLLAYVLRPLAVELVPRALRRRRAARSLPAVPPWAGPKAREVTRDVARLQAQTFPTGVCEGPDARYQAVQTRAHYSHIPWLRHQDWVATGIGRSDPYLDRRLVRTVMSFDPTWLLHGNQRRGLFREAIRGLVPESVRTRCDKARFEPAFARLLAGRGVKEGLLSLARGDCLADLGVIEPASFASSVRSFLQDPAPEAWLSVWPALACEAFLEKADARSARSG